LCMSCDLCKAAQWGTVGGGGLLGRTNGIVRGSRCVSRAGRVRFNRGSRVVVLVHVLIVPHVVSGGLIAQGTEEGGIGGEIHN